jgi:hypothetical protein
MYTFESYQIGEDSEPVQISSSGEHHAAACTMSSQSKRNICIISRELDPTVYNVPEFINSVKKMILAHSRSRLRVIVFEPRLIATRGHLLLDLAAILPSFIEFRTPGKKYKSFNESLFVADNTAYIYRNSADRFDGTVNFNDRQKSKVFMDVFEEMWTHSTPDPNLRRMSL